MPIHITLDAVPAQRGLRANLTTGVGVSEAHLRSGKLNAVPFETLAKVCEAFNCKPCALIDSSVESRA